MEVGCHQGKIASERIRVGSNSYEKVKTSKCLDPFYYSVQTLLSSILLSKYLKIKIYKTMIFKVMICGSETWSLTLREECRLRVSEKKMLRRKFGLKRDENGEWRRLHNEELHNLYRLPNIVRVIKSRR